VSPRVGAAAAIALGGLSIVVATVAGSDANLLDPLIHPPAIVRAALVGACVAIAALFLARGLARLSSAMDDVPGLVRGVRLIFLAIAALAAAAGWLLGEALPLLVALVIAGIDVVETSFLLLVVAGGAINRRG